MILWVSGSRSITSYELVEKLIVASQFDITELAHGDQRGKSVLDVATGKTEWFPTVDLLAEKLAKSKGIAVKPIPADWKKWGLKAGPIRNGQGLMWVRDRAIDTGDEPGCLAIWDGVSRGTNDSFDKARNIYGMITCRATIRNNKASFEYFNCDRQNFVLELS
jgi:hypothetical protein